MSFQEQVQVRLTELTNSLNEISQNKKKINQLPEKNTHENGMYIAVYDPTTDETVKFPFSLSNNGNYVGRFSTELELTTAFPNGNSGFEAIIDPEGADSYFMLWDITEEKWVKGSSGGGSGGSSTISEDFTVVLPNNANIGYNNNDIVTQGTSLEDVIKKILRVGEDLTFTMPTGSVNSTKPASLLYEIGQILTMNIGHSFNQNDAGALQSVVFRKDGNTIADPLNYQLTISQTSQSLDALINYAAGSGTKVNAIGEVFENDIDAGSIDTSNLNYAGQYPFFYGKASSKPTANQSLIDSGTKAVNGSLLKSANGTITINFNADGEFIWFAVPQNAPSKTTYYKTALDTGSIDLIFEDEEIVLDLYSPSGNWIEVDYKFYISKGVGLHNTNIELRN